MKKGLCFLLALTMLLVWGCAPKETCTVKFYDGETIRLITEVQMEKGSALTVPDIAIKEGCSVKGLYMTSTLSAKYPDGTKVTEDMVVFIEWQYPEGEEPTDTQTPSESTGSTEGPAEGTSDLAVGDTGMTLNEETQTWHAEVVLEAGAEAVVTDRAGGETWKLGTADSAGSYMALIWFEEGTANVVLEKIAYYVVGTCGNGGWAADAVSTNTAYQMIPEGDVFVLDAEFGDGDIGADGKVTFKVARGAAGVVTNWYGNEEGESFSVAPGNHTITFDPATAEVLFG